MGGVGSGLACDRPVVRFCNLRQNFPLVCHRQGGNYPQFGKLEPRALVAARVRAHAGHRVRDQQLSSRAWCVLGPRPPRLGQITPPLLPKHRRPGQRR